MMSPSRVISADRLSGFEYSISATRAEAAPPVALKKDTFYGIVKIRCGKKTSEIDARPSDAIALAVLNEVPIFVAEDVLETTGVAIPETVKGPPTRQGMEKIIKGLEESQRQYQARTSQQRKKYHEMSQEDKARRSEELITSIFGEETVTPRPRRI